MGTHILKQMTHALSRRLDPWGSTPFNCLIPLVRFTLAVSIILTVAAGSDPMICVGRTYWGVAPKWPDLQ